MSADLSPDQELTDPAALTGLDEVRLDWAAVRTLQAQLYTPVRPRGGLLFGSHLGGVLHVRLAGAVGPPARRPARGLRLNAGYVRGWREGIQMMSEGKMTHVGQWVIHADSQLRGRQRDRRRVQRAITLGLVDDRRILVVPGWRRGELTFRAYAHDFDGQVQQLPCRAALPDVA